MGIFHAFSDNGKAEGVLEGVEGGCRDWGVKYSCEHAKCSMEAISVDSWVGLVG